jgi:hypothetical protein
MKLKYKTRNLRAVEQTYVGTNMNVQIMRLRLSHQTRQTYAIVNRPLLSR